MGGHGGGFLANAVVGYKNGKNNGIDWCINTTVKLCPPTLLT